MSTSSHIASLRLVENGAQTRNAIAAAAADVIRSHRASPYLRIVLAGDELPTKTIAALISALRKLREVGGALELTAENKAARQIVRAHGLEGVFQLPFVPVAPLARGHWRRAVAHELRRAVSALGGVMGRSPGPFPNPWWMVW